MANAPRRVAKYNQTNAKNAPACRLLDIQSERAMPNRAGIECNPSARSNSKSWHAYSTSKPAVQSKTTSDNSKGIGLPISPRTAIQAPVGAMQRHQPSTMCESWLQRFVNEYRTTLASATGASINVNLLSMAAASRNSAADTIVNAHTKPTDNRPAGNALIAVLGFLASNWRSTMRLKAIAVDRAPTIATTIHNSCFSEGIPFAAKTAPNKAKGNANKVCSILIISSVILVFRITVDTAGVLSSNLSGE